MAHQQAHPTSPVHQQSSQDCSPTSLTKQQHQHQPPTSPALHNLKKPQLSSTSPVRQLLPVLPEQQQQQQYSSVLQTQQHQQPVPPTSPAKRLQQYPHSPTQQQYQSSPGQQQYQQQYYPSPVQQQQLQDSPVLQAQQQQQFPHALPVSPQHQLQTPAQQLPPVLSAQQQQQQQQQQYPSSPAQQPYHQQLPPVLLVQHQQQQYHQQLPPVLPAQQQQQQQQQFPQPPAQQHYHQQLPPVISAQQQHQQYLPPVQHGQQLPPVLSVQQSIAKINSAPMPMTNISKFTFSQEMQVERQSRSPETTLIDRVTIQTALKSGLSVKEIIEKFHYSRHQIQYAKKQPLEPGKKKCGRKPAISQAKAAELVKWVRSDPSHRDIPYRLLPTSAPELDLSQFGVKSIRTACRSQGYTRKSTNTRKKAPKKKTSKSQHHS